MKAKVYFSEQITPRHGTQQLLRGGRRQHRGHQRVRVRVRVPGGARHHPCRGYRVPHPHALKGA